jgi:uncharacterized protein (UPF0264 family)
MTRLLVSVRSAAEAEEALAGGADLIDVKEPARGSLGRAPNRTVRDVIEVVAGRRPVSAAMGELLETLGDEPPALEHLAFAKWGLTGYGVRDPMIWPTELDWAYGCVAQEGSRCRLVAVAYADWQRAKSPLPADVANYAVRRGVGAFLLDTWHKDGMTLLDWLSLAEIGKLRPLCKEASVPVALAGSLGPAQLRALKPAAPDWFAVRGAVCRGGHRNAAIDRGKVRQVAELVAEPLTSVPVES